MIAARRSETPNGAFMKRNDNNQRGFCMVLCISQSGCLFHVSARTEGLILLDKSSFPSELPSSLQWSQVCFSFTAKSQSLSGLYNLYNTLDSSQKTLYNKEGKKHIFVSFWTPRPQRGARLQSLKLTSGKSQR